MVNKEVQTNKLTWYIQCDSIWPDQTCVDQDSPLCPVSLCTLYFGYWTPISPVHVAKWNKRNIVSHLIFPVSHNIKLWKSKPGQCNYFKLIPMDFTSGWHIRLPFSTFAAVCPWHLWHWYYICRHISQDAFEYFNKSTYPPMGSIVIPLGLSKSKTIRVMANVRLRSMTPMISFPLST